MARFTVLFVSMLLLAGSAITRADDLDVLEDEALDTNTTSAPTTTETTTLSTTTETTTLSTTTETTTPSTTTPTTTPSTTTSSTTTSSTTTPSTTTPSTTTPSTTIPTTTPSTTPPTTTPAPKPDPQIKYSVTENNVTCVMIAGQVYFNVNYTRTDKTTVISKVFVPNIGVTVDGSCNGTDGNQWISFTWGKNSAQMNFDPADKDSWTLTDVTASLYMDDENFVNATQTAKTLDLTVEYDFSPGEVTVNHSFICRSELSSSNVSATIDKDAYAAPVTSTLKNIQIQAYNKIVNEKDFVDSVHCSADNTSDIVPIAVGCALAALVVIVLIAYLVGRRRRSGAYQSV